MVKIGAFPQETPRGTLEEAWSTFIRPVIQGHMETAGIDGRAPYMLSSQLEARFLDSSQARLFLAALRKQDIVFRLNDQEIKIWGTIQKPKEVRERNRRLLRVAECLNSTWPRASWSARRPSRTSFGGVLLSSSRTRGSPTARGRATPTSSSFGGSTGTTRRSFVGPRRRSSPPLRRSWTTSRYDSSPRAAADSHTAHTTSSARTRTTSASS